MATPSIVQYVRASHFSPVSDSVCTIQLPNNSLAGNTILVSIQVGGSGTTATVADDQSQSYTQDANVQDTTNSNAGFLFRFSNTAAGVKKITVTFNVASVDIQIAAWEVNDLDPTQGTVVNKTALIAASGTIATGAFTPNNNDGVGGNFLLQVASSTDVGPPAALGSFSAAGSWTLRANMRGDGFAAQTFLQTTSASINPTITGDSHNYWTIACAYKVKTGQGSLASGMRVVGVQHIGVYSSEGSLPTIHSEGLPMDPGSNGIIVTWLGDTGHINSITDSVGNTYQTAGAAQTDTGGGNVCHIFYAKGATCSATNTNFAVVLSGSPAAGSTLIVFEVAGADTATFFDTRGAGNGTQAVTADLTTTSVTPSTSSGIIIAFVGVTSHCCSGLSSAGWRFLSSNTPGQDGNDVQDDQSNGWSVLDNTSTAAKTPVWTIQHNTSPNGVGLWASIASAWLAAVAATGIPRILTSPISSAS